MNAMIPEPEEAQTDDQSSEHQILEAEGQLRLPFGFPPSQEPYGD